MVSLYSMTTSDPGQIDRLDAALIELLAAEPRVGVLEASRRLGVARGTVQARLDRLTDRGVITGYGPEVDPAALGYEVTAFITLEIRQAGGHDPVAERTTPSVETIASSTRCRSALVRATTRQSMSPGPVMVCTSSTSGIALSRSATGSWPPA